LNFGRERGTGWSDEEHERNCGKYRVMTIDKSGSLGDYAENESLRSTNNHLRICSFKALGCYFRALPAGCAVIVQL